MLTPVVAGIETTPISYVTSTATFAPVPVTQAMTVTESDTTVTNLTGATIQIQGYVQNRDLLAFTAQPGISSNFNTGTGVLTLTGTAPIANYVAAINNGVTYQYEGSTPTTAKIHVLFQVTDSDGPSPVTVPGREIDLINGTPSIVGMTGGVTYQDHSGFIYPLNFSTNIVPVSPGLNIIDADTTLASNATAVSGATVTVVDRWNNQSSGQDNLVFTSTGNISGHYDSSTGVLTLSGPDTLANYQTVLRSIQYQNITNITADGIPIVPVQHNLDLSTRLITYSITTVDGTNTAASTGSTTIGYVHESVYIPLPPVVTGVLPTTISYTERAQNGPESLLTIAPPVLGLTPGITVPSASYIINGVVSGPLYEPSLEMAKIQITGGTYVPGEDELVFQNTNTIGGTWDATNGILTLSGVDSLANWNLALQSVQYTDLSSSPNPQMRVVSFDVWNDLNYPEFSVSPTPSLDQIAPGILGTPPYPNYFRNIVMVPVDAPPVLNSLEQTPLPYVVSSAPPVNSPENVSSSITVLDPQITNSTNSSFAAIESATATISQGYVPGEDQLIFNPIVPLPLITATWIPATGTISLTGVDTLIDYTKALQSIQYVDNSHTPSLANRAVTFAAVDYLGTPSKGVTRPIVMVSANSQPVLSNIETAPLKYTDHNPGPGAPIDIVTPISTQITVSDPAYITSATITITAPIAGNANNVLPEDMLVFTNTPTITGNWNAATGTLTLTGYDTAAKYSTALQSVSYKNLAYDLGPFVPSTLKRVATFTVTDQTGITSAPVTRNIQVSHTDDAPTVTIIPTAPLFYVEKTIAQIIAPAITISDPDSVNMNGATIQISPATFNSLQDSLVYTSTTTPLITAGAFDTTTGTLTLSGTDTIANYETALQSIGYTNSSNNPGDYTNNPALLTRVVSFQVTDDQNVPSFNVANRTINITPVNDPPQLSNIEPAALNYTDHLTPPGTLPNFITPISSTITTFDPDSVNLSSATIQISPATYQANQDQLSLINPSNFPSITAAWSSTTGTLTLSGTDTVADYMVALQSVGYQNLSATPNTSVNRVVNFTVTDDGNLASNTLSRTIIVNHNDDAPVISNMETSAQSYTENINIFATVPVTQSLIASDADSPNLTGAVVTIGNFAGGQDLLLFTSTANITGSWNSGNGTLTLTGNDTPANYTAALRSIAYQNLSHNPTAGTRQISFVVTDDQGISSQVASRNLNVFPVNNPPLLASPQSTLAYGAGTGTQPINASLTVSDPDSPTFAFATITLMSPNPALDTLGFAFNAATMGNIALQSNANGVLTLVSPGATATQANWQSALDAVTFNSSDQSLTPAARTATFILNDGSLVNSNSNAFTTTINIGPVYPPVLTGTSTLNYIEKSQPAAINSTITVADPSSGTLATATIAFTNNTYVAGQDLLGFVNDGVTMGNIAPQSNSNGVLTLASAGATATLAQWQSALRAVTYANSSYTPSLANRSVSFTVNTGGTINPNSNSVSSTISITRVYFKSTLTNNDTTTLNYTEGATAAPVFPNLGLTDPDSTNLKGAVVQIAAGYNTVGSLDTLVFANTNTITGSFNVSTGTLTLTGTDTVANYQAALQSIGFFNQLDQAAAPNRVVSLYVIDDTNLSSNTISRTVAITVVNNAPVLSPLETTPQIYKYNDPYSPPPVITNSIVIKDVDSTMMSKAIVSISANYNTGHERLGFDVSGTALTGSWNSTTGQLTITGNDTIANYDKVLNTVVYINISGPLSTATRTISFKVFDNMGASSNTVTRNLAFTNTNVAPTVATNSPSPLVFVQGQTSTPLVPAFTVTDPDSPLIQTATIKISAGYQLNGDKLIFSTFGKIKGVFQPTTATIVLTGADTQANYQAAIRSILFVNVSNTPSTAPRTVSITVSDGLATSNIATRQITIQAVDQAPVLSTNSTGPLSYSATTGGSIAVAPKLTVTDADNANLTSASIQITSNYQRGKDFLVFVNTATIKGTFNQATGILTLTGIDTVANYRAALQSVMYKFVGTTSSTVAKTISFTANDGQLNSTVSTQTINVGP